jgi:NAD(P)-dependent dehydrogenase (short-subunit alcohol dehydrogenase family)
VAAWARARGHCRAIKAATRLDGKAHSVILSASPATRARCGGAELISKDFALMPRSEPKVALVTGAARGIGLATARRFLAEGWRVALLDIEADMLRQAVASLDSPENTLALHCDVSNGTAVQAAIDMVGRSFSRLDALINNAAIAVFAPVMETTEADWTRILAVNLNGPFICTKAAVPLMREGGGGAIVNITSISAVRASTLRSAYGTSKAGLAHLTKQLAVELASSGIRVNGVAPGPVDTAMALAVHTPDIRADYHDAIPLNRYGLEEELAEAIFFLGCDRSSYITGQILAVDGGFDAAGIGLPTLRGQRRNR